MRIRHFHVRPSIPKELAPLREIAGNLWFSWNWEAVQLFIRLSPRLWEKSYQNPVQMLGAVPQATWSPRPGTRASSPTWRGCIAPSRNT
jgi:starch phosphorylase